MKKRDEYYQQFMDVIEKNGLKEDICKLYQYERESGNAETAFAILALIPDFGYIDKVAKAAGQLEKIQIDGLREVVSEKLLRSIEEIRPAQFNNLSEAEGFDRLLYRIDGSMLTAIKREEFDNMRQTVRIDWQTMATSDGKIDREKILSTLNAEIEHQVEFRRELAKHLDEQIKYEEAIKSVLQRIENGNDDAHDVINTNILALKKKWKV